MSSLPIENGKIAVYIEGENPEDEQEFAAVAGLNLKVKELEFLSAIGLESLKKLNLPHPEKAPKELRRKIIEGKITATRRGERFSVKEADQIFENFFDKYADDLIDYVSQSRKDQAISHIKNTLRKKILDRVNSKFNVYFLKFSKVKKASNRDTAQGNQESEDGKRTSSSVGENSPAKSGTVPVSPLVGVQGGIKASQAQRGDRIQVKLAEKAVEKMESKCTSEQQKEALRQPRNATILDYTPGGESEGRLEVELQDGISGSCTVSNETLLKPGEQNSEDGDSYEKNLKLIIWFLVTCIVIIAAGSLIFVL